MPDTIIAWFMFSFYTIGAAGGVVYLTRYIMDKLAKPVADDEYDPWEPEHVAPVLHSLEPPLTTRRKP